MKLLKATIHIQGTRPFLFNHFSNDSIPLERKVKSGVAGNNPEEWKTTYLAKPDGQLYVFSNFMFSSLRSGAKHTAKGRGSLEPDVTSTLQVVEHELLFNRHMPKDVTNDPNKDVYIDVRPVTRGKAKNIRYRLALSPGWETTFSIIWDGSLISPQQMHTICIDAGRFYGIGDGRKIGCGRYEVHSFVVKISGNMGSQEIYDGKMVSREINDGKSSNHA